MSTITQPSIASPSAGDSVVLDMAELGLRNVNRFLQKEVPVSAIRLVDIEKPGGAHNIAVGLDAPVEVHIRGHAGYYAAGMNKQAKIVIYGNVERGVAENIMSGTVRVKGNASEAAGASGHGGMLVIEGDAAGRCGISLKGADIVVGGSVGHAAMFMAQAGRLVVCGDAGPGLGDSLYEAVIYVAGRIDGLGADARQEPMSDADRVLVADMLQRADLAGRTSITLFKRIASARTLYHWNSANHAAY